MAILTSSATVSPWSDWKRHWRDNVTLAVLAAGLETGALSLFVYMFVQDFYLLSSVTAVALLVFLVLHIGISASCALILSHSKTAASMAATPPAR